MKKVLSLLLLPLLFIGVTACSNGEEKEKFNAAETKSLITEYDNSGGTLTPEQFSKLIKNTRLLFIEIKDQMKSLLDITDNQQFTTEYKRLKSSAEFMDKLTVREQAWRVLILGQKNFSEQNLTEFGNLPDESMLIDYYDDCIYTRLTNADNDSIQ